MSHGRRPLWALLLLAACDPSAGEERDKIASAIDRMRAIPSARAADQKAEAEALRKIEVKTPKAVRARDACADAYQAKAELWLLIDEVSAQTSALKSPPPASVAQELADKMGQMQVLEQQTEADLAACTRAMSDLTTSK